MWQHYLRAVNIILVLHGVCVCWRVHVSVGDSCIFKLIFTYQVSFNTLVVQAFNYSIYYNDFLHKNTNNFLKSLNCHVTLAT